MRLSVLMSAICFWVVGPKQDAAAPHTVVAKPDAGLVQPAPKNDAGTFHAASSKADRAPGHVVAKTPTAPAAKAGAKVAKKLAPPKPLYPARTAVETSVTLSELRFTRRADGLRVLMRYRFAAPLNACPPGLHLFSPLGYPGDPVAYSARWGTSVSTSPMSFERAPRLPTWAHALAGPEREAGVAVHVPAIALASWCAGREAILELESLLPPLRADADDQYSLLLRMSAGSWGPLGIEKISFADETDNTSELQARWCTPEPVGPWLSVLGAPVGQELRVPPAMSARRENDDLCLWFKDSKRASAR